MINTASTGAIALTAADSENINMAGYPTLSLGAAATATLSGQLTPAGTTYYLGGGGATLTVSSNLPDVYGQTALVVNGSVTLTGTNTYSGLTTINTAGTVSIGPPPRSAAVGSSSMAARSPSPIPPRTPSAPPSR